MTTRKKIYEKKDPIEHCLLRPDMYIGSTRLRQLYEYVAMRKEDGDYEIVWKNICSSPAILRIFIEALSNAIDNVERSRNTDTPCTKIKVNINRETGETSIWNDGDIVPIEMHDEGCYNHTLIFGQLLTGSSYNDEEERKIAGRNGIGVKTCNIYSKNFEVKGYDPVAKKLFTQTWTNNMRTVQPPKITTSRLVKGFTQVTWTPDFSRFGMKNYTTDIVQLYTRHVLDAAMLSGVSVYFNGELIPIKSLTQYSTLYNCPTNEKIMIKTSGCTVLVTPSTESQVVSFVNGVYTRLGGQHVDAWSEAIFRPIVDKFNGKGKKSKSKKSPKINIADVRQFFRLFIVASVIRPEFDGQEKNKLESPAITAVIKKSHINSICKWSVMDKIEDIIRAKEMVVLRKAERKKKNVKIDGLDPANNAGGKYSRQCSLFICEGLSAKTYVVTGIETGVYGKSGRDWFGVLPVTGKVLNVRNATPTSIAANKVIVSLIQALGLSHGVDYRIEKNFKTLRYGKVITVCDADCDGIHIEALIMNLIHALFPTLLERKDPYIVSMKTPIARVFRGRAKDLLFYDERRFNSYIAGSTSKVNAKYYKGLGTTREEDVPDTFGLKMVEFFKDDNASANMNKVFHKKYSDARKQWLTEYDPDSYSFSLDDQGETCTMSISNFLNKEMIKFSHSDCARSIPSGIDGLKESQRKILYAVRKRKLNFNGKSLKVAQLSGYTAEHSNYHHGEQNLQDTIVGMASGFPGTNNIPLLYPDGGFGCLDPETPILMWDGDIKVARNIHIGDNLIGDDGTMRTVRKIVHGNDIMFDIVQDYGITYRVNSYHILTLYYSMHKVILWKNYSKSWVLKYFDTESQTIDSKIVSTQYLSKIEAYQKITEFASTIENTSIFNINLQDYLNLSEKEQTYFKAVSNIVPIQWDKQKVPINPYIFGYWLGDTFSNGLVLDDTDITEAWIKYSKSIEKYIISQNMNAISGYNYHRHDSNLISNKHVPNAYIYNTEKVRLQLLAGVIDARGTLTDSGGLYRFEIIHKEIISTHFIDQLQYIARSLGFRANVRISKYVSSYIMKTLFIYGDLWRIPTRVKYNKASKKLLSNKRLLFSNFTVKKIGLGKFCGWDIDKNERFLLGDFTVTHNTRLEGGNDAASARYIFTKKEALTDYIFRIEDDPLLTPVNDDGDLVQPEHYIPIIPMILVNGCTAGIGTGWSCTVPCFNPIDIIDAIRVWIDNDGEVILEEPDTGEICCLFSELVPWYRGFKGDIQKSGDNRYKTEGIIKRGNKKNTAEVTELPIGMWTNRFKETCEDLVMNKTLKNLKNYSTTQDVHFILTESADGIICNKANLKLHTYLYTSNMVLFNEKDQLKKYKNTYEIINNFCTVRLQYYDLRKKHQIKSLEQRLNRLGNKQRFITEVIKKTLLVMEQDEIITIRQLDERHYDKDPQDQTYNYLLRLPIRTFTTDKVKTLKDNIGQLNKELSTLQKTKIEKIWLRELNELEKEYNRWMKLIQNRIIKKSKSKSKIGRKK